MYLSGLERSLEEDIGFGMGELWTWLRAICFHWLTLISGGILITGGRLYAEMSGQVVAPFVYAGIAMVALMSASFLAWRDEHRFRERLESQMAPLPLFEAEVMAGTISSLEFDNATWSLLKYQIVVRNVGDLPSIVRDWQLDIPAYGICSMATDPHLIQYLEHRSSMLLDEMPILNQEPIQPGSQTTFPVTFAVSRNPEQLRGVKLGISFRDVKGNPTSITWAFPPYSA